MGRSEALSPFKMVAFATDIIRNTSVFLFAQIASRIVSFIYMLFLAASLPTNTFGALSIALTVLVVADTIADLGLSRLTARTLSRDLAQVKNYPSKIIPLRLLLSLMVFAVCVAGAQTSDLGPDATIFIIIIGIGLLVTGVSSLLEGVLQSQSRFGIIGLGHVGLSLVQAMAGYWVISSGGGSAALAMTFLVSNLAFLSLLLVGIMSKQGLGALQFDPGFWISQLKLSLPYAGSAIVLIVSMRCELLIMSWVSHTEQVAFFSVAARLNDAAILGPIVLASVLVPQYSKYHHEAPGVLTQGYIPVLRWGLISAIPAAMIAALLIEPVLSYLLPAYAASAHLAAILFATMPLFAVYQLNSVVLLCSDSQGRSLLTLAGLLIVQLALGMLLIPVYSATGAAISYAVWTVVAAVVSTFFAKRWHMNDLSISRTIAPAFAGAVAMAIVLWLGWDTHLAIKILVASATYAAAILVALRIERTWPTPALASR